MSDAALHVSAPGKVILFGEHAVVYGKPALAAAVSQRTHVTLSWRDDRLVCLRFESLSGTERVYPLETLREISDRHSLSNEFNGALVEEIQQKVCSSGEHVGVLAFLYAFISLGGACWDTGCMFHVASEIPIGAGMGSSASFAVALCACIRLARHSSDARLLCAAPPDSSADQADSRRRYESLLAQINHSAFLVETIIHGTPSGIDNTVSTYGGAIVYQREVARTPPVVSMRKISRLPPLCFVVTDTHVGRSTKELVAGVRRRRDESPNDIEGLLDAIEATCNSALLLFDEYQPPLAGTDGDASSTQQHVLDEKLFDAMSLLVARNHELLNQLGVGHAKLDEICSIAATLLCSAKLTGAGGGGCAISLVRDRKHSARLQELLASHDFKSNLETTIGGPGLIVHAKCCNAS